MRFRLPWTRAEVRLRHTIDLGDRKVIREVIVTSPNEAEARGLAESQRDWVEGRYDERPAEPLR